MKSDKVLYHAEMVNKEGLPGRSYVKGQGELNVPVSSPLKPQQGANPEQFVGLALATCLNATLQAIEKQRGFEHKSQVQVGVDMMYDTHGYQFMVDGQVLIPDQPRKIAEEMLAEAETRCPVAKLLQGSANVHVHVVDVFDFATAVDS